MSKKKKRKAETIGVFEFVENVFPTERSAVRFLERRRWGNKVRCARCNITKGIKRATQGKHTYWCKKCRQPFNVKTGTALEGSKIPYRKWLYAMYLMVCCRMGVSSVLMAKQLHVSLPTGWFIGHRLRQVIDTDVFGKLTGVVEVDEMYLGGVEENKHKSKKIQGATGGVGKTMVVGLKQRGGKMRGYTTANAGGRELKALVRNNVEPGSTIMTDECRAYSGLKTDYVHKTVNHSKGEYVRGDVGVNAIEGVWSIIKRGFHGVYHHWDSKHAQRYVREFAFRLGIATCEVDVLDRIGMLFCGLKDQRLRYVDLVPPLVPKQTSK